MEKSNIIKVSEVAKSFPLEGENQLVLDDVNFEVQKEEFLCLVGPSGCGKSTLLRIMANLIPVDTGRIEFTNKPTVAMVFQNFALFPWLTVDQNVAFGLKMQGLPQEEIKKRVSENIEAMGLKGLEKKHPKELSGGMKQRVGIARALAIKPEILFLDEPFSSLDVFTASRLRQDLLSIWQERKMTIVMISHLVEEAIELSDRVIVLTPAPGTVKLIEEIKLERPRNKRSEEFFNYVDKMSELIKIEK